MALNIDLSHDLDFQGLSNFVKPKNGRTDWQGMKRMCVDRKLVPFWDFEFLPHPWPWISKVKSSFSRMGRLIIMEWKECESIRCWTYYVTLSITLTLEFQGQILKKLYLWCGVPDWHENKGMWDDSNLDPLCDFELWPHPWPWPWIVKVKFWKICISGIGGSIDMEQKGCELIVCWTHYLS